MLAEVSHGGPVAIFRGNWCLEMEPLAGDRVVEREPPGVEHETTGLLGGFARLAVNRIADERGAFVMEMDAYLMGAAGVEVAEDESG